MTVYEKERRNEALYRSVVAAIADQMAAGTDVVQIGAFVAELTDVDRVTAHKWVQRSAEEVATIHRAIAVKRVVVMWGAIALTLASGVWWYLTRGLPAGSTSVGGLMAVAGSLIWARRSPVDARNRWVVRRGGESAD